MYSPADGAVDIFAGGGGGGGLGLGVGIGGDWRWAPIAGGFVLPGCCAMLVFACRSR
jgi:hypothetical protein